MGIGNRLVVTASAAALVVLVGAQELQAAPAPVILSATTAKDAATGRTVVTLVGKLLTKFTSFALRDSGPMPITFPVEVLVKGKTSVVLLLPAGISGDFDLTTSIKATPGPTLHLTVNGGVLFGGGPTSGAIPAEGPGTRMMWYPAKAALRAGAALGTEWDDFSVGRYSTATGYNTKALGQSSTALGGSAVAFGNGSTALGIGTLAGGDTSTALGSITTASGDISTSMGNFTTAQAYASLVLGQFNVLSGTTNAWVPTEPVLVVGNGSDSISTSNAFTLLKNGNLTIAGTLTQNSDARLKADIAPLTGVVAKLAAVHGVSYRFKDERSGPDGRHIGLVAQEVRDAFPELVSADPNGTLSVAYGNFSAVLLEAIREQQADLVEQQAALDARDREVDALKKELAEVRAATDARLSRLEALVK